MSQIVTYELVETRIACITLNRPENRNAQNLELLYALDDAFTQAVASREVKVIVLAAAGPHFSAGHDLRSLLSDEPVASFRGPRSWAGFDEPGGQGFYAREQEAYLQLTRRWRDLCKPTIAAVQGRCIAGGLMLAWACDLIVAADDAQFSDPTVAMGVCGVEWFAHPWELGSRKAKEMLFTGDSWTAAEAMSFGMVNQVVPAAELLGRTLDLARRIACKPAFALQMAKAAVNGTLDIQGQKTAIDAAFSQHHLCHNYNRAMFGMDGDPSGFRASPNTAR